MTVIPPESAVRSPGVRRAMAGIAAGILAADQVSKSLVLAGHPADGTSLGWVSVRLVRNTGASGGIASRYPVLVTLAALVITVIAVVLALRARGRVTALCLAAVVGGAAGNLADRVARSPGLGRAGVVDWIHFAGSGGSMDIADLAIQFGVLGAVVALLAGDRARSRARRDRSGRVGPGPQAGDGAAAQRAAPE